METIEWWPRLEPETQAWLVAHNGEAVDADVLDKIGAAGGVLASDAWWIGESGPEGFYLSDEAVDWIETTANGESTSTSSLVARLAGQTVRRRGI